MFNSKVDTLGRNTLLTLGFSTPAAGASMKAFGIFGPRFSFTYYREGGVVEAVTVRLDVRLLRIVCLARLACRKYWSSIAGMYVPQSVISPPDVMPLNNRKCLAQGGGKRNADYLCYPPCRLSACLTDETLPM